MLLIDDLVAAPFRGLMFVLREIANRVEAEREEEERRIPAQLAELNRRMDQGEITEKAFEAEERALLARLDRLHGKKGEADAGGDKHR